MGKYAYREHIDSMNMEQAIKDLQDAMTVMAHLERRQSELLLQHSENLAELQEFRRRTDEGFAKTATNLSEITDKLNGLIGYVDGLRQPPAS
jgi:response regulator RpfG family c-di-GMP phosphodiesterase